MMAAELCKYTQTPAHFRRVALMVCELYLKLKKKQNPNMLEKYEGEERSPQFLRGKEKQAEMCCGRNLSVTLSSQEDDEVTCELVRP